MSSLSIEIVLHEQGKRMGYASWLEVLHEHGITIDLAVSVEIETGGSGGNWKGRRGDIVSVVYWAGYCSGCEGFHVFILSPRLVWGEIVVHRGELYIGLGYATMISW